jgi:predicted ATPase
MDVAVWLRGLGLEQYEALFRENDIDAEVLSDLTDGDLEKIGVSLGHRKRLLRAVAALAGPPPAPQAAATPIPAVVEAEARAGESDRALAILDEALAICERTDHRTFDAELNRVRGELLLQRDPANAALAEEVFQTALAIARKQRTRSFELRAALALAKLYQSIGRPADAHTVLAPALEGFSPTPEMPEIAEA